MDGKEKVPKSTVLDDMYNPNSGIVSGAARDYYYNNYATVEEKRYMDREDKFETIFVITITVLAFVLTLTSLLLKVI